MSTQRKPFLGAVLVGASMWGVLIGGGVLGHRLVTDEPAEVTPAPQVAVVETELPVRPPIEGLPECPTEDSEGPCNWYGGKNGKGLKFAALPERGEPVPADMREFLSEEPGQANRDWSVCTWYVGDTSYVVCPDGYSVSS
jgi:hypothetical protein